MINKLVVMHLRQRSPVGWGGVDTRLLDTIRRFNPQQIASVVVYLKRRGGMESDVAELMQQAGVSYFEVEGHRLFDRGQFDAIVDLVERFSPDIIHCNEPKSDAYGYLLKRRFPTLKVMSTIHGWTVTSLKGWLYKWLDIRFLKRFDRVMGVSQQIKSAAQAYGIQNVHVIENGIDLVEWQRGCSEKRFDKQNERYWIGYVGRVSAEKAPLDFVALAAMLHVQYPRVEFVVAGLGEMLIEMRRAVAEQSLDSVFHFLGELDAAALKGLYQQMDMLVSTSLTEGLPYNLLEASAMQVPIVATRVGGVPELIEHGVNGLLSEARDIEALFKHVALLIEDPSQAQRIAERAHEVVEQRFSVDEMVQRMEKLYRELAA